MNYEAKWGTMVHASNQISKCADMIRSVSRQAAQVKNSLYLTGSPSVLQKIKLELQNCITSLDTCSGRTTAIKNLLSDSADMYMTNERKLAGISPQSKGYLSNISNASNSTPTQVDVSIISWESLLKVLGQFGIVGGLASTAGSVAQNDTISIGRGIWGFIGEGAKLVSTMMGKTETVSTIGFVKTVDAIGAVVAAIAGATASLWAVGVVSVGVSLAVDVAFQAVTGQGMAEFVSEKVVDGFVTIGKAIGDGVNIMGEAVASWFSKPLVPKLSW